MLVCAANRKFLAFMFKFPNPVAKFLLFCSIYRLKTLQGKDKKGIYNRNQWIIKDWRSVVQISRVYIQKR